MGYIRKLSPLSEKTLAKNELSVLPKFWVADIESFKWIHLVTIGLTDGESFNDFGVTCDRYAKEMKFKSYKEKEPCLAPVKFVVHRRSVKPYFIKDFGAIDLLRFKRHHCYYLSSSKPKVSYHGDCNEWNHALKPWKRDFAPATPAMIKEAIERMLEFLISDGANKKIYAHFGGKFDFLFFLNYMLFNPDWVITSMIPRGSGILCFDAKIELGNGSFCKLTFNDSSAMLPFGLKSLTQNFKVESLKKEWNHAWTTPFSTPDLVKYCEFDCRGLHQVIEKYHTWPIIKRAGSASTIAGQAMRVIRTTMNEEVWSLKPRVDRFVRSAYFGGRTEIFKPLFKGPGRLRCADVNSLYPTIMRDPPQVGNIPRSYPIKFKKFTHDYDPDCMGFFQATVEVPDDMYVPPLGLNWSVDGHQKYVFPTGVFTGVWSTLELEYARSLGVKILSTGKGAIFESGDNYFRKYVDDLYEIREKSERESVDNVLAKLLLNSCYGRFGLRTTRENLEVDDGQAGLIEGNDENGFTLENEGKLMRLMRQPKVLETFNNVAVSAWVTSGSRVFMHRLYMKHPEALYYTDTDSMFTTDEFTDEKGLGGLKLEYECKAACFLLPKTYVIEGIPGKNNKPDYKKVTMKGFDRKKTSLFTVDDFMTALEGDLRRLCVRQEPKFATFKTALGKGKILTMLPGNERQIRSMYDKRVIIKGGPNGYDTRAHKIVDEQPIVTHN